MTQSTEQERAEFEAAFIAEKLRLIGEHPLASQRGERVIRAFFLDRAANGDYISLEAYFAWWAWQAARRAPAVQSDDQQMTTMVDAAMVEMQNITPPLRRSECKRLIVAAMGVTTQPPEAKTSLMTDWRTGQPYPSQEFSQASEVDIGIPISKQNQTLAAPVQLPEPFALYDGNQWFGTEEAAICACADMSKLQKVFLEQQVRQQLGNQKFQLDELAMLTRKLVQSLRKAAPGNESAEKAMEYLKRKGLAGSPLRSTQEQSHGKQT